MQLGMSNSPESMGINNEEEKSEKQLSMEEKNLVVKKVDGMARDYVKSKEFPKEYKSEVSEAMSLFSGLINSWSPEKNTIEGAKESAKMKLEQYFINKDEELSEEKQKVLDKLKSFVDQSMLEVFGNK